MAATATIISQQALVTTRSRGGGAGDDGFVYRAGDGNDTISDLNAGNSGALNDDDPTESFFPGPNALHVMSKLARNEVFTLFLEIADIRHNVSIKNPYGNTARIFLDRQFLQQGQKNARQTTSHIIADVKN